MAKKSWSKLATTSLILLVVFVTVASIWGGFALIERFNSKKRANLGDDCENLSCCNGQCVRVGGSRKCMNVLRPQQCGCDDPYAVCMAGGKCINNVCYGPREQKFLNGPSSTTKRQLLSLQGRTMEQCKKSFFPREKVCTDTIQDDAVLRAKNPLPRRDDGSQNVRFSSANK